jgi:hypothetical protein
VIGDGDNKPTTLWAVTPPPPSSKAIYYNMQYSGLAIFLLHFKIECRVMTSWLRVTLSGHYNTRKGHSVLENVSSQSLSAENYLLIRTKHVHHRILAQSARELDKCRLRPYTPFLDGSIEYYTSSYAYPFRLLMRASCSASRMLSPTSPTRSGRRSVSYITSAAHLYSNFISSTSQWNKL